MMPLQPLTTSYFFVALVCLAPTFASAQATRADYERADRFAQRFREKVSRARVEPRWLASGSQFWYRIRDSKDEARFIFVDADLGERREAFDHDRLAETLASATGKSVLPRRLPFDAIEYDETTTKITFAAFGKSWEFDVISSALRESEASAIDHDSAVRHLSHPHPSRNSRDEIHVEFKNAIDEPVTLTWIDRAGKPRKYETIRPGDSLSQHTFVGHVWTAVTKSNRVVGTFEAVREGTAVIDGEQRTAPKKEDDVKRGHRRTNYRRDRSPDGKWRAFIHDHNVYVRHSDTADEHQLSREGSADDPFHSRFLWSPDSKQLVVIQETVGEQHDVHIVESSPDDQLQPRLHTFHYHKPGDRIPIARPRLFDLETLSQIDIDESQFENAWSISKLHWAEDSSHFTFLFNQRGHQTLRVIAVDTDGTTRTIINEQSKTFVDYAGKLFYERINSTNEIIWMSERDGWNHLYLYDALTGSVKHQITQGEWVVRKVDRVDHEARQIYLRAGGIHSGQDPYYEHYVRVNFDGSELTALTIANGTHDVSYSPDGRYLIDRYSRVDLAPVTELRRVRDGTFVCELERASLADLRVANWPQPEAFQAKARDGTTDIYGVIYRPSTFDPQQRYPVVEKIYAGPHGSFVPKSFNVAHSAQRMAELGFIVVQIDGMGTSNRSKAFHDVCWKNLVDAGLPDRIKWMQAAARKYPQMDLTRVGIYGGSAGGQNALAALLTYGDFYKVGVADCGCHDNRMDKIWWNELWMGWPIGEHYAANSNVTLAKQLRGKLLLIVGELDRNVDPASTMQVVDALIKADKDFDFLMIPGAGHGAAGTPYGRRRLRDFLVEHLQTAK